MKHILISEPMNKIYTFKQMIQAWRNYRGLTRVAVAKIIKVDISTYNRWEQAARTSYPNPDQIKAMAVLFKCKVGNFFNEVPTPFTIRDFLIEPGLTKRWTPAEEHRLSLMYEVGIGNAEIAKDLDRSEAAIVAKLNDIKTKRKRKV